MIASGERVSNHLRRWTAINIVELGYHRSRLVLRCAYAVDDGGRQKTKPSSSWWPKIRSGFT